MKKHLLSAVSIVLATLFAWFACPAYADTAAESLAKIKQLEPKVPTLFEAAKASLTSIIPDPAAYEKSLPPFDKVTAGKDITNLKNYGGLAEAYFYHGNPAQGLRLHHMFAAKADRLLPGDDTFQAGVAGDIGIYYFTQKNYGQAKIYLLDSTSRFEKHLTAANANNLVSDYLCLTLIMDKEHKTNEAQTYAKKMADLVTKQHHQAL
jgi:hypothetical protein